MSVEMPPFPTINLNGTSAPTLADQTMRVVNALDVAISELCNAEPHGRDYQIGPHSYINARTEFVSNLEALRRIRKRYAAMHEAIVDQQRARNRRS